MKKNLKASIEKPEESEALTLLDMNRFELIEGSGMISDLAHRRTAHMTALWKYEERGEIRIAMGGSDLSGCRYLNFSVFSVGGEGGSFALFFESGETKNESEWGSAGYEALLPITKDGWNDYRLELPYLKTVGDPVGWNRIDSIRLSNRVAGQKNRKDTRLYFDSFMLRTEAAPHYTGMPELKGAAVFSKGGNFAIVDRKRLPITSDEADAGPYTEGGTLYLPMAPVAAVMTHSAVVDNKAGTLSFTYRRKKYFFSAENGFVTVNGERQELAFTPAVKGGTLFFPADYVREFFRWRQLFTDQTGLIILSNRPHIFEPERDRELILKLVSDTVFLRPDGNRILGDMARKHPNRERCRLLLSEERMMELRRAAKKPGDLREYVKALKSVYGVGTPYFQSVPINRDVGYGEEERKAEFRRSADLILSFSTLYRLTGDRAYAERAVKELLAAAAFTEWNPENPAEFGRLAFAEALGYDWCRKVMSEGEKARIERAMLRNVLRPAGDLFEGKGKMWAPGSAESASADCGILAVALMMSDYYPETVLKLLNRVLFNLEPAYAAFAPDGGYADGIEKWETAVKGCALTVAVLESACGNSYGLASAPGFSATALFPVLMSGEEKVWNLGGMEERPADSVMAGWFAGRFGGRLANAVRREQLLGGKIAVDPMDLIFHTPVEEGDAPEKPNDAVYRKAEIALLRGGKAEGNIFVAVKGGKNSREGATPDLGEILLEAEGVRFFTSQGRRTEEKNCFTVGEGSENQERCADAALTEVKAAKERSFASVDLANTYEKIVKAKRGILLTENRSVAVIQDEVTLEEPERYTFRLHTDAEVKLAGNRRSAVLEQNGKKLAVRLVGIGSSAKLEAEKDGETGKTCISVRIEGRTAFRLAVACRVLREEEERAEVPYEILPISRWNSMETK